MLETLAVLLSLSSTPVQTAALSATNEVDVELILAVDVSRSMDEEELQIQRDGYVNALRHAEFLQAVRMGLIGRIAISYYEWSGSVDQSSMVNWQVIESAEDADAFAAAVEAAPLNRLYGTSISGAIEFGSGLFDRNEYQSNRHVIDVSGDGPNNRGLPVTPVRDLALSSGVVINGLAIMIRPSASIVPLDKYYADCVTGGPGSFVLPVRQPADFATAIRRKLVMEISGLQPSAKVIPVVGEQQTATDCMIGEKLRYDFNDR